MSAIDLPPSGPRFSSSPPCYSFSCGAKRLGVDQDFGVSISHSHLPIVWFREQHKKSKMSSAELERPPELPPQAVHEDDDVSSVSRVETPSIEPWPHQML